MELAFLYKVHQPFEGDDAKEERNQHSDEQSESELSAVGAFFHQRGIFNRVESLAFEPFYKIQQGGSTDCRNAHEKAELARIFSIHALE